MDALETIARWVGLSVDAPVQHFVCAIDMLKNRAAGAEALLEEKKELNRQLRSRLADAGAKTICNRAAELQKQFPYLSFSAAFTIANNAFQGGDFQPDEHAAPSQSEEERAKRIITRADALQKENPKLSFMAAFRMAIRLESEGHVRGRVRHLDERIAAAKEGLQL
jgi:hypothetical protein